MAKERGIKWRRDQIGRDILCSCVGRANGGGGAMAHRVRDLCAGQKETRRFREGRTGTDIKISGRGM